MSENKIQYRGSWSTAVPNDLIRAKDLSYPARFLWILLRSYASPDSPCPFPKFETLAYFMANFRKDPKSGQIVRKGMDELILRKYRQELVDKGFLIVERRRNGHNVWESNIYTLLDGHPEPHRNNSKVEESLAGEIPARKNSRTKSTHILKEVPQPGRDTSSSNNASSTRAARAAGKAPAGLVGRALRAAGSIGLTEDEDTYQEESSPEVRQEETYQEEETATAVGETLTSKKKATAFTDQWKKWYRIVHQTPASIIPREVELVEEYFSLNEDRTPLQLIMLAVGAWMVKPADQSILPSGVDPYWHCHHKSRKIASFVNHIPEIEEQIMPSGWDASDEQMETIMNLAKKRFKLQTA
jgi:hypothetical protein